MASRCPLSSFEKQSIAVSVALLFDSTGSMQSALPPLKSGALKLIGEMRPARRRGGLRLQRRGHRTAALHHR